MWARFTFITGPWIRLVLLPSPQTPRCNVPGIHCSGIVFFWCILLCFVRLWCRGQVVSQMRGGGDAASAPGMLWLFGSFLRSSGQDIMSPDMSKTLQSVLPGTLWTVGASSAHSVHWFLCVFSAPSSSVPHDVLWHVLLAVSCDGTWYLRLERRGDANRVPSLPAHLQSSVGRRMAFSPSASGSWF